MKVTLEIFTNDPASIAAATSVLALLAGAPNALAAVAAAPSPAAPAPAPTTAAPAPAPAPVAPPAPAPASPSSPPAPAPAAAPAPAPAAPPPPAAGGITAAQFGAQVQAFAKAYSAKACKARFTELSAAFGQAWDKTSAVPAERYAEVMPWFATA